MYSVLVIVAVIASSMAQNENCPLCSLGYPPPPNFYQQQQHQQQQQQQHQPMETPHTMYLPTSFGSYPTHIPQPESMQSAQASSTIFGGNAQAFGTELGKAIAQRIQQIYSSPSMQQFSSQHNQQNTPPQPPQPPMNYPLSFNSYPTEPQALPQRHISPEPSQVTFNPPHHPYTGQLMNTLPGTLPSPNQMQQEPLNYRNIIEPHSSQKSCPYCFGNQYNQLAASKKKS